MIKHIQRFMRDEAGAATAQFAIVVAGLSLAILTVAIRLSIK